MLEKFDIPNSRVEESALLILRAVMYQAMTLSKQVTNEMIFSVFLDSDGPLLSESFRELGLKLNIIRKEIEESVNRSRSSKELYVSDSVKLLMKIAMLRAQREGRSQVVKYDILGALFEDSRGSLAAILKGSGKNMDDVWAVINQKIKFLNEEAMILDKRYELPPFLKHFAANLNREVRKRKIHPVFGRDSELNQVIEILCHVERANSVMLLGEPGVGKTAIVEGLAMKIELEPETVPKSLRTCQIVNLQMNNLVAGTMLRGMFEDRIQNVIREIKANPKLILFIDEAHTMIGAGSALGAPSDAANIFKSVLSKGEVRIIGATTLSEYKQLLKDDEAFERRFRSVYVYEQSIEEVKDILFKVRPRLESNYSVTISDEVIETAVLMSSRYDRHLHLPDKPIGWIDTAAVKAQMRDSDEVMVTDLIDAIAGAARIPKEMIMRNTAETLAGLEKHLNIRVVGQFQAKTAIKKRLFLSRGKLKENFDRPDGVFLFLGPTGVGKTEMARSLAEYLFGDEKKMIRIDMSEYQSGHAGGGSGIDKLIGMPRGIVGSERGGILTNQLRDNPYSVVLLDEIEKASSDIPSLFLQAFDEGWITDGRGKRVYLSDSIIIMTSNLGSECFRKITNPLGFLSGELDLVQVRSAVLKEVEKRFSPEFCNRIDKIVVFDPLTKEEIRDVARIYLEKTELVLAKNGKILVIEPEAMDELLKRGFSLQYGARFLKRIIDEQIKEPISELWNESNSFRVILKEGEIIVKADGNGSGAVKDEKIYC